MKAMAGIMAGDPERLTRRRTPCSFAGCLRPGTGSAPGMRVVTGDAAGRQLYVMSHSGDVLVGGGHGDADKEKFTGVKAGDQIHVDNRKFLAFCYFHRHHIMDDAQFDGLRVGGQADLRAASGAADVPADGRLLHRPLRGQAAVGASHPRLVALAVPGDHLPGRGARAAQGADGAPSRGSGCSGRRTRSTSCPPWLPPSPLRASNTDWSTTRRSSSRGWSTWPAGWRRASRPLPLPMSTWTGRCGCPPTAAERGGVQPVVSVTANGGALATVAVGEPVTLSVHAEAPAAGGTIVSVQWDFDGKGALPVPATPSVDGIRHVGDAHDHARVLRARDVLRHRAGGLAPGRRR